jgi:hypothetical protein
MGAAYDLKNNVDFERCWNVAQELYKNGSTQYFIKNPSYANETLTYDACEKICGTGIDVYSSDEILGRFTLWLLPSAVLIGNYYFATISTWNTIVITVRHLSNPIDSLWSLLTRFELQRRLLHKADELVPTEVRREDIEDSTEGEGEEAQGNGKPITRRASVITLPGEIIHTVGAGLSHNICSPAYDLAAVLCTYDEFGYALESFKQERFIELEYNFDEIEREIIKKAAHKLIINRTESRRPTFLAIAGYLGALSAAFIRTRLTRQNNQTSHTVAIVSLLSYFVALVLMSSALGVFEDIPDALYTLQNLHDEIELHRKLLNDSRINPFPQLYAPKPQFHRHISWMSIHKDLTAVYKDRELEADEKTSTLRDWHLMESWTGMNSSWRPEKTIPVKTTKRDRSEWFLLFCSIIYCLGGCYIPALVLSYFAGTPGFGCRCLAWSLVAIVWLVSFSLDQAFKYFTQEAKKLWRVTMVKDFACATYVAATIISVQWGVLNSCKCRGNVIFKHFYTGIYLGPFTKAEWDRNWVVWPATSVSCFVLLILFGCVVHVIEYESGSIKFVSGVLWKSIDKRKKILLRLLQIGFHRRRNLGQGLDIDAESERQMSLGLLASNTEEVTEGIAPELETASGEQTEPCINVSNPA